MAKILGIDLGTTNSAMAVWEGSQPEILVNAEGDHVGAANEHYTKLYVLVNKDAPTLYITVSLMTDVKAETSSMEWYSLTLSDELLAAWNNRKEVAK